MNDFPDLQNPKPEAFPRATNIVTHPRHPRFRHLVVTKDRSKQGDVTDVAIVYGPGGRTSERFVWGCPGDLHSHEGNSHSCGLMTVLVLP